MTKSKKTSKTCQKFDFRMEPKATTLFPICFLTIAMHSVCRCSLPVWIRSFLKKVTPVTYFGPALDPPLGGSGPKTTTLVRDHEYFIPTKFHQNISSGSGEEVENVKVYRRQRRRTTGGRRAVRYDTSSLEPSAQWAKKVEIKINVCLWNTDYAPGGNKVQKSYFLIKGQSQGHKVIDLGVISKGIISGVCIPIMKSLPLTAQKL